MCVTVGGGIRAEEGGCRGQWWPYWLELPAVTLAVGVGGVGGRDLSLYHLSEMVTNVTSRLVFPLFICGSLDPKMGHILDTVSKRQSH